MSFGKRFGLNLLALLPVAVTWFVCGFTWGRIYEQTQRSLDIDREFKNVLARAVEVTRR